MHGLRAENHAKTTSVKGPSSIMIARGILFWTGNQHAEWKIVSRFVNMGRLLLLGTYPSRAYMENPGLGVLSMRTWRSLAAVGIGLFMSAGYGQGQALSAQKVDRAVVATRLDDSSVYVGWRFLPTDAFDAGFNVYRQGADGAQTLVNDKPITDSTNLAQLRQYWMIRRESCRI